MTCTPSSPFRRGGVTWSNNTPRPGAEKGNKYDCPGKWREQVHLHKEELTLASNEEGGAFPGRAFLMNVVLQRRDTWALFGFIKLHHNAKAAHSADGRLHFFLCFLVGGA